MNELKRALWKCDDSLKNKQTNIKEQTVFQEELIHIKARRDGEYLSDNDAKISEDSSTQQNLVGLAFSGGGIRSATFGLGVLEALKNQNLLQKIDYLSTVSGGGYIGAWLSANCKRATDCDIRVCLTNNEIKKNEIIIQFKTEFSSKKMLMHY
jgi:predicted acylesterase/phospholipase RssA